MIDAMNRKIDHLRMSVTNRCNLDCFYCHKEGNSDEHEMTTPEAKVIITAAHQSGLKTIKFTGGEPMLRTDIVELIEHANNTGFEDISMTTNGTLLGVYAVKLKKAGLIRVNVGCDSTNGYMLKNSHTVWPEILAAKNTGLGIKLNMVVLRDINDHQIQDMIDFCVSRQLNLQLIELIRCEHYEKHFYSLEIWEQRLTLMADKVLKRKMQNRKKYFWNNILIELVRPSKEFCKKCNKLRVTSSGKVNTCLIKKNTIDFVGPSSFARAGSKRDTYGYD